MITNIIFALLIIFLMAGAFFWMWKLSKWLVIPIQIILFALLIVVVVKVFATKENADRLHDELEKSGIAEVEKQAVSGAVNALKKNYGKDSSAENTSAETASDTGTDTAAAPETAEAKPQTQDAGKSTTPAADSKPINFVEML